MFSAALSARERAAMCGAEHVEERLLVFDSLSHEAHFWMRDPHELRAMFVAVSFISWSAALVLLIFATTEGRDPGIGIIWE